MASSNLAVRTREMTPDVKTRIENRILSASGIVQSTINLAYTAHFCS